MIVKRQMGRIAAGFGSCKVWVYRSRVFVRSCGSRSVWVGFVGVNVDSVVVDFEDVAKGWKRFFSSGGWLC